VNLLEINEHAAPGGAVVGLIREVRLARPPVNALNAELLERLIESIEGARGAGAGAVVITGQPGVF
jgi:3,2-trans-enoyl-CoA isomerase